MEKIHIALMEKKLKYLKLTESIRAIRTNILSETSGMSTFLVTSTRDGEGKSTVSLLLALALSKCGKKVVWVNCDNRKKNEFIEYPVETMEEDGLFGLSDVLLEKKQLYEVILPTKDDNLFIMLEGTKANNLADSYENEIFKTCLNQLKERFDYVILDSISEQKSSDTKILASKCDGVIFVIQYKKFSRRIIAKSLNNIKKSNGNIVGAVLNKVG